MKQKLLIKNNFYDYEKVTKKELILDVIPHLIDLKNKTDFIKIYQIMCLESIESDEEKEFLKQSVRKSYNKIKNLLDEGLERRGPIF